MKRAGEGVGAGGSGREKVGKERGAHWQIPCWPRLHLGQEREVQANDRESAQE